uniref:16S rRNA (uracil(1498)-N(3))-methyltransferase n=1 Tax=Nocardia cyriacigeorgica TaxID=135487 RepID=UPI00313BEEF4
VGALHQPGEPRFPRLPLPAASAIMLTAGPVGGPDDAVLAARAVAGPEVVLLGPTVLRTSTAAAVALGALGALTARWG